MAVGDAHVVPGFLTPVIIQISFQSHLLLLFFTCFRRGERRKYAGQKFRLNRGSNSQPLGHESDTLTTEPPWQDTFDMKVQKMIIVSENKDEMKENIHIISVCLFLEILGIKKFRNLMGEIFPYHSKYSFPPLPAKKSGTTFFFLDH